MIEAGKKYLVSTDNWFIAPDGEQYRSVWGTVQLITAQEAFGFVPARPSTNWFAKVGSEENHVIVAGCQIHYAVKSEERPVELSGTYKDTAGNETINNRIFFAE